MKTARIATMSGFRLILTAACLALLAGTAEAIPQDSETANSAATPVKIESGIAKLSPANTRLEFTGTHVGDEPKPRLGGFEQFEGTVEFDNQSQAIKSINVQFQMDSIWTEFDKLTAHLKTADFFDTQTFPTAEFKSTSIVPTGEGAVTVTGQLTLHGTTTEINFPATFQVVDGGLVLQSQFTLDRTQFGMDKMTEGVESTVSLAVTVGQGGKQSALAMPEEEMASAELVSLTLPNMHCAGCAATVKSALEGITEISDIEISVEKKSCQFRYAADSDVATRLNELAGTWTQFKDWSRAAEEASDHQRR